MSLFVYDPSTGEDHLRRSFQDYDVLNSRSSRRDSAWQAFKINARMQRAVDRNNDDHSEDKDNLEHDMLLMSLSSFKPSSEITFSKIGAFLGFTLFSRPYQDLSHEKD